MSNMVGCVMIEIALFSSLRNVKVVTFGKTVLGMTIAISNLLRDHIVGDVASVPVGSLHTAHQLFSDISTLHERHADV